MEALESDDVDVVCIKGMDHFIDREKEFSVSYIKIKINNIHLLYTNWVTVNFPWINYSWIKVLRNVMAAVVNAADLYEVDLTSPGSGWSIADPGKFIWDISTIDSGIYNQFKSDEVCERVLDIWSDLSENFRGVVTCAEWKSGSWVVFLGFWETDWLLETPQKPARWDEWKRERSY